jgi:nitronate monooxygenase
MSEPISTSFTQLLGLQHPIMQAPVGPAAGPELAAAVSNAGGLGSVAVWTLTLDGAKAVISQTRTLTSAPFAVNIHAGFGQHDHAQAALEAGAQVIHLFWGDPAPFVPEMKRAGARVMATVADGNEAKRALDAGIDVLIAQGAEAGGHVRGTMNTLTLVPRIVDLAGSTPVLAAGGIADGRGLAAALALGAAGASLGTRFLASHESRAHAGYKQALVRAAERDTVLTTLFDVGWPDAAHRTLRNSTVRAWEMAGRPLPGSRPGEGRPVAHQSDGRPIARYSPWMPLQDLVGDWEPLALFAGQSVELITSVAPAATLVTTIARQAEAVLNRFGQAAARDR